MSKICMERERLDAEIPAVGVWRCIFLLTRNKHLDLIHARQPNYFTYTRKRNNAGGLGQIPVYHRVPVNSQLPSNM